MSARAPANAACEGPHERAPANAACEGPHERAPANAAGDAPHHCRLDALLELLLARRSEFLEFVKRRVRGSADAEDLLQSALLHATERLHDVRDGDKLDAWFYRMLRNTIADHHTAWAKTRDRMELLAREAAELPQEEAAQAALCACGLGVMNTLGESYANILRVVDIEEASLEEAAASLGITVANAKVRLHRARAAMRQALLEFCGCDSMKKTMSCNCGDPDATSCHTAP